MAEDTKKTTVDPEKATAGMGTGKDTGKDAKPTTGGKDTTAGKGTPDKTTAPPVTPKEPAKKTEKPKEPGKPPVRPAAVCRFPAWLGPFVLIVGIVGLILIVAGAIVVGSMVYSTGATIKEAKASLDSAVVAVEKIEAPEMNAKAIADEVVKQLQAEVVAPKPPSPPSPPATPAEDELEKALRRMEEEVSK